MRPDPDRRLSARRLGVSVGAMIVVIVLWLVAWSLIDCVARGLTP